MRKSVYLIICCCLLCLGCQEELETTSNGSLNIFLTDEVATTRTLPDALSDELIQQFDISLLRDRKGAIITEYSGLLKDFGNNRILKVGTYRATASYGEDVILALDAPYYYGEVEDVSIKKNKATSITITCKVANSLATFEIVNPAIFEKYLKDYYVEIKVGEGSVRWQPGDTTHPYFKSGSSVQLALKGTSTTTGEACSYTLNPIDEVVAGMKYKYKLKISPSNVGLDVETEQQQEPVTINETVPESWLPAPKISSSDFDEEHVLRYTETADATPAVIDFSALRPVQEVEFTLNFVDEHLKHLNKTYVLSGLSVEDKQMLEAAGIVLPDLSTGITIGSLDFTGVTSGLLTHNGGQDVDNTIAIKVKANDRLSEETVYTIRTVKPIIKVGYYPGNLWTKEFTINPLTADSVKTGNFDKLTDIVYEFSTDGNSWENMPGDLQKTNLNPGTSYYVRARYRGEVPGETMEIKTYPQIELENGGLENPQILDGDDGNVTRGTVYGWDGWSTLNRVSTPSGVTAYSFNSRSGCRPTDDGHTGKAVRVITLGYVMGGFAKPKSAMHSELYLGVSADDNGGNKVYGIDFNSRPTALEFWYKCISNMNNDVSLVKIQLLHDDVVLGENSFTTGEVKEYQYKKLEINYFTDVDKLELKPNKLLVLVKSGTKDPLSVSDLKGFIGKWDTVDRTADATFRGNELFVDDISLIYDR
ncbi:DUF4493 domain-containing protein [Bacteroides sp.]